MQGTEGDTVQVASEDAGEQGTENRGEVKSEVDCEQGLDWSALLDLDIVEDLGHRCRCRYRCRSR